MTHQINMNEDKQTQAMRVLFEKVENKDHWKGPIDAVIRTEEYTEIANAVMFFTATTLEINWEVNGSMGVSSVGYWDGPAGPG